MHEIVYFTTKKICETLTFWNLLAVSMTLLYIYWWRRPHPRFPPGPRGIPLLGTVPFLGLLPSKTIKRWSLEKYGPVMSVRIGSDDCVFLNTFDAVNQALVKQSAIFSDRHWVELLRLNNARGIVARRYDESFKTQKHFGLKFLRQKCMASRQMEAIVNEEGNCFVRFVRQFGDKPLNLKKYFYWLTLNVISKTVAGKRHKFQDPDFVEFANALESTFGNGSDAPMQRLLMLFTFLSKLPVFAGVQDRLDSNMRKIQVVVQQYIDEHRENFDPNCINDFIDAFLFKQKFENGKNESFTEEQLLIYCQDLFFAGTETNSSTLTWCIIYLLHYPEYHKIVEKEIEDCLGTEGVPSMSQRDQMPVTCAFIHELMRVKTILPLVLPHLTTENTELMGYFIPKGSKVIANLDGVHMDPIDWPNPEVFNPRRHIDENGRFVPSKKIISFGMGSRFCLGESLARVEIFIFLVKLVQQFNLRSAKMCPPPMDQEVTSIVLHPKECKVILEAKH